MGIVKQGFDAGQQDLVGIASGFGGLERLCSCLPTPTPHPYGIAVEPQTLGNRRITGAIGGA